MDEVQDVHEIFAKAKSFEWQHSERLTPKCAKGQRWSFTTCSAARTLVMLAAVQAAKARHIA
eukprot:1029845-Amphidinium_carterae.1